MTDQTESRSIQHRIQNEFATEEQTQKRNLFLQLVRRENSRDSVTDQLIHAAAQLYHCINKRNCYEFYIHSFTNPFNPLRQIIIDTYCLSHQCSLETS